MKMRRRGFTLIELLVVIAIIAILAAMLFPVFARARESARKIQCLSNVKNIAMAIQMYLSDYDRLPPAEHRAEVLAFFGDRGCDFTPGCCTRPTIGNPFLRWPVVLDEYIKNRDVWTCPSAKMAKWAEVIVPDYYPGGWLGYFVSYESGFGGDGGGPCWGSWPSGWGGDITDSMLQQRRGNPSNRMSTDAGGGAATFSYSIQANLRYGLKTSQIKDPSWFVAVSDRGAQDSSVELKGGIIAYPDVCTADCPCSQGRDGAADCPWAGECGTNTAWRQDPSMKKQATRHLGGSNLGFMDGHAQWMAAEAILAASPRWSRSTGGVLVDRKLEGLGARPTSAAGDAAAGIPEGWIDPCVAANGWAVLY